MAQHVLITGTGRPLGLLFERRREDKEGPIFITHTGEAYPW